MRRFCLCAAALLLCLLFSCKRTKAVDEQVVGVAPPVTAPSVAPVPTVAPLAVLQAGEFPLWFQFTVDGPVLIETIEDACFSAALVPWPLAPHVRFMLAQGEDLLMAVNRDGFISLSPREGGRLGLYRFSGGEFWRRYTVGAFLFFDNKPAALLYSDDRFLDSGAPPPSPRLWSFDPYAANPKPFALPSLAAFAPQDGWDIDVLRRGGDGLWYFRAIKKAPAQLELRPEIRLLRSDLVREGEQVSLSVFQNAALPEPLSAAPGPLQILAAVFAESGSGLASVVSPEFQTTRTFTIDREKPPISGFYSANRPENTFLLATTPQGNVLYAQTKTAVIRHFSMPPLPEGFCYTGIGMCGDTIFASWEEQEEYSIGAAGFMVIRLSL
jgi:hypothetical protein